MKVIIEQNVPYLEVLDTVADVRRLPYSEITAEAVKDADALIVRTRNRCNAELLEGSSVKFIATATIGTDHIDLPWCEKHGITVVNAPGSNAPAVAQYVFSSLMRVINRPINQYTIGIVGVGHVGSLVERWAHGLGMKVLLCDPPRQKKENNEDMVSLAEVAQKADIITFHTPLTKEGADATFHLGNQQFFNSLRRAPIIINSARGAVIDNKAWLKALESGLCTAAIIDCWEDEPEISSELLAKAAIATPHIAGYSAAGKQRASQMALDAFCRHFGFPPLKVSGPEIPKIAQNISKAQAASVYNPEIDTMKLKSDPASFEAMRNNYNLRPELPDFTEQ